MCKYSCVCTHACVFVFECPSYQYILYHWDVSVRFSVLLNAKIQWVSMRSHLKTILFCKGTFRLETTSLCTSRTEYSEAWHGLCIALQSMFLIEPELWAQGSKDLEMGLLPAQEDPCNTPTYGEANSVQNITPLS